MPILARLHDEVSGSHRFAGGDPYPHPEVAGRLSLVRGFKPHAVAAASSTIVALAGILALLTVSAEDVSGQSLAPDASTTAVADAAVFGAAGPVDPLPRVARPAPAPRRATRPLRISFIGDSVAWSTAAAMRPHVRHHTVLNHGIWGCGVVRGTPFRYFGSTKHSVPNNCDRWPREWRGRLERDNPDVVVIMVGRWELMDRVHDGRWTHVGDPAFDRYLRRELDKAIDVAGDYGRVVVATTPYYRRGAAPGGGTWPEDVPARVDRVNELLRAAAARNHVPVVDFGRRLSPGGRLAMDIRGTRLRTDGVHIAADAGAWLASWFPRAIVRAAG